MQKTAHILGAAKRQSLGKGNRNPRVNKEIAKEMNAAHEKAVEMKERRKGPLYGSVRDLFQRGRR